MTTGPEIFLGAEPASEAAETEKDATFPPTKKAKTKSAKKDDPKSEEQSVDDLKARLAALEAENKALKQGSDKKEKGKKKKDAAAETVVAQKSTKEADPKNTKKKAPKKGSGAKNKNIREKEEESDAPAVDVSAWQDFQLDSRIMGALSKMGFSSPTHVQAECIPAAVRDRRDVIGAAQTVRNKYIMIALLFIEINSFSRLKFTDIIQHVCIIQGSGKTLAFGLPILDLICQAQPPAAATDAPPSTAPSPLRALILAPTRELAMQVCNHLQSVGLHCGVWVVPIVGGISAQKQERLLKKKPQVIVATPGRLWALMQEGHAHVSNLGGLQFLVIDEADRMVQQGHYAELSSILDTIPGARAAQAARKKENGRGGDEEEEYQDPDEILPFEDSEDEEDEDKNESKKSTKKENNGAGRKKIVGPQLQTFVFSATLTLPGDMRKRLRKGGGGASGSATLESLMDKVPLLGHGKPKIVDLTSDRKVADKISEACISCPEAERDEYLYCLLASHPGRTIVFVNAISAVRRLAAILKLLGLPIHALHAGMQQRARLKALDRFRGDPNGVLVATDVAARGLDVKDVRCVVHYQLPASLDVYVHRSGRTARADADGIAIALVTPKEDARYRALLRSLGREEPPAFPLDVSLMAGSRERVRLAVKLDSLDRKLSKERADFSWRKQNAEEIGIVLSDDSEDEMVIKGKRLGKKARKEKDDGVQPVGYREIEKIRGELNSMLAEPLQPKFSKKFFTGGAAGGVALQQQEQQEGGGGGGEVGKKGGKKKKTSEGENETNTTTTTTKAVSMAQHLSDSRAKAVAAAAGSNKNKTPTSGGKNKKKKQPSRAEALAAAIRKQVEKKAMKGTQKRGMVVVSQAMGRNTKGPDALQALRARFGPAAGADK
jgi:ATP-dependent RNA helicase DDX24/MAK5